MASPRRMLAEEGDEVPPTSTLARICRWAEEIWLPRSFTIYDTDDASACMKAVYKDPNAMTKFLPIKSATNPDELLEGPLVSRKRSLPTPPRTLRRNCLPASMPPPTKSD